ncbi:MAG TPA: DNA polymerase III subunit alpha [Thermoanaerobaculia bacterium]|nr:DNA polymerase III subunit alpha [Thermoanaerobaculia bacterium]
MASDFVHLHLHSQYSLLDGANRISELCGTVAKLGQGAVAVTDHGNMFGAYAFWQEADRTAIKPIFGVEAYIAPGDRRDRETRAASESGEGFTYHLTLLARNQAGYKNLVKLVSEAYLTGFYHRPRMDKELLREHAEGLIALSGCLKGEVAGALSRGNFSAAKRSLEELGEIFGKENVYVELMDHGLPDQTKILPELLRLAKETGFPPVATNDSHYLTRNDAFAHEVLLCIGMGKTLEDERRMRFYNDEFYVKDADEMKERFAPWSQEAVTNSAAIAARCSVSLKTEGPFLPNFHPPPGRTAAEYFRELAREGLERRFAEMKPHFASGAIKRAPEEYVARLDYEMDVIEKMGFPSYFLIVSDFIRHARETGVAVGPGRGSAAGSIVSWALRITAIDPLRYDLLFERFLNPERRNMPDIDIDFCQARRGEIIEYVTAKYGRENVAQIVTFSQLKPRAAVRDVARVLGFPVSLGDRISKAIPGGPDVTFESALKDSNDLKALLKADESAKKVVQIASRLEGLSRHAGMHAAGVVIAPQPITEFVPLYRTNDDQITTQFDMTVIEKMGLLKIDFLGLITLDILLEAVASIRRSEGVEIDLEHLPLNDEKTYELFREGKTGCVFQFDSSGMRDLLRRARPAGFTDLAALNALYRPGALDAGTVEDYVRRRNGTAKITYPLPELKDILEDTLGILVYQEQVMRIAQRVAGYSLAEADDLRKAIGKKKKEIMQAQAEKFIRRAVEAKTPKRKAEEIWSLIEPFARYGFNKSHAVAYALLAYQTAYLKAHWPIHFMAACLTSSIGSTDEIVRVMGECAIAGVPVRPPDINESRRSFAATRDAIRFGLAAVRGVGDSAAHAILEEREKGPFSSYTDFLMRVDPKLVNRRAVEALVHAGAFDSLGRNRRSLVEAYEDVSATAARRRQDRENGQTNLFGGGGESEPAADTFEDASPYPMEELLSLEKESLGFYVTGHPLAKFSEEVERFAQAKVEHLADWTDRAVKIAGVITGLKKQKIKKGVNAGKFMAKFLLEDTTGTIPVAVFSALFEKSGHLLEDDRPILLTALVREGGGSVELNAQEIAPLAGLKDRRARALEIRLDLTLADENVLSRVHEKLRAHPGPVPVSLRLVRPGEFEATVKTNGTLSVAPSAILTEEIRLLAGERAVRYVYD